MVAAAGYPPEEMTLTPITYDDMRPGCFDPKARLEDMDPGWVEASMCFPTLPAVLRPDVRGRAATRTSAWRA